MGPGVGAQRRGPVPEGCLMKSIMTALAPLKGRGGVPSATRRRGALHHPCPSRGNKKQSGSRRTALPPTARATAHTISLMTDWAYGAALLGAFLGAARAPALPLPPEARLPCRAGAGAAPGAGAERPEEGHRSVHVHEGLMRPSSSVSHPLSSGSKSTSRPLDDCARRGPSGRSGGGSPSSATPWEGPGARRGRWLSDWSELQGLGPREAPGSVLFAADKGVPPSSRSEGGAEGVTCWAGRKLLCGGGGGDTEAHFPNPPPSLLGRRDGRGGSGQGCPNCRAGGGGSQPNIYGSK